MVTVTRSSTLAAGPEPVRRHAISAAGINYEFRPWLRMTLPDRLESIATNPTRPGTPLFRNRILLLGFLPVDYEDITYSKVTATGFHERSTMRSARHWEHERTVVAGASGGCTVTDTITFEPRIERLKTVHRYLVGVLFSHCHRRLRRRWRSRVS